MDFDEFLANAQKEKAAAPAGNQKAVNKANGKMYSIFLVDDLKSISSSMKREIMLAARASEVSITITDFQDPELALEELQKSKPDLLITDVKMPYLTGDKLVEAVKKVHPELPVIVVTGFATKENILSVYKSDKNSIILSKPWESKRLIETVALLLQTPLVWPED